jgi:ankyrin repeat protein
MSDFLKCDCPHCGQHVEYPAEGTGLTVPCPTCEKSFVLSPANQPSSSTSTEIRTTPVHEPPRTRKAAGSNLSKLTEETIKAKTQNGDTPLHRAAKTGRISEIPRHLLRIELFMAKNNSFARETPLHLAARYGHLDQVPKEFLTKETLTASTEYERKESKTGPTPPRTETPLHYAAQYGHADQIPQEFLRPEFLTIEATGYRLTVLHQLAYAKKLDLVPEIYANSEMWNLRNSQGQTPREVLAGVIDQERRRSEREAWRPPRLTLPIQTEPARLLPVFSGEALQAIQIKSSDQSKTYIVNLLEYTCTCPLCLEIHSGVPARDYGRLCKHIILALRKQNLVAQLPPIARGIVENGLPYDAFGIYPGRFAEDLYGRPIYITGKNYDGWISIFALWRRNGVNYSRFAYNVNARRWYFKNLLYLYLPKVDESLLY